MNVTYRVSRVSSLNATNKTFRQGQESLSTRKLKKLQITRTSTKDFPELLIINNLPILWLFSDGSA